MEEKQKDTPHWLKVLQENSWELELLISGGAIFSLLQFSTFYIEWIQEVKMTNHFPGAGMLLMVGMLGIKILTLGFTLHLISRAFWIAIVCINFVYPSGIKHDKIKWQSPFKVKLKGQFDLKDQIIKVDQVCGTIMFTTIVAAFSLIGLAFAIGLIFFARAMFGDNILVLILSNTLLIALFLYFIDFLFFGFLRKIPGLNLIAYPFFSLFDTITFRRLFQKSLWLFNTNINRFKFSLLAIVFCFTALIFAYNAIYSVMHWPNLLDKRDYTNQLGDDVFINELFYLDQSYESERFSIVGIQSKVVNGNYLEVFIRYDKMFDPVIAKTNKEKSMQRFQDVFTILIDNEFQSDINWYPTKKVSNIIGISAMLPLKVLSEGKHQFTFRIKDEFKDDYTHYVNRKKVIDIPFWIDRSVK